MSFTPPDLSEILTNEQELNTRLNSCKSELQSILTKEGIGYTSAEGIIPLIRKLPYPTPTSIVDNKNFPIGYHIFTLGIINTAKSGVYRYVSLSYGLSNLATCFAPSEKT